MDNLIDKLSKEKENIDNIKKDEVGGETIDEKTKDGDVISDGKDKNKPEELKEEEFIDLAENIIDNIFDDIKNVPMNKVEKYIDEKEKEEDMNELVNLINNLNKKDKENMLQILNDNADNNEKKEILRNLNNKINEKEPKIDDEVNSNLIKQFNKNNLKDFEEKKELNDDQLGNLTNELTNTLFKEGEGNAPQDENEKEKNINKTANIIKDLNKKDQNKVLSFLKENADDPNKKDQIEKVDNLVNNMNGIKLYIKGIVKKRVNREKNKEIKELEKDKLDELTQNMIKNLFKEEKEKDSKDEPKTIETTTTPTIGDEKLNNMANTLNKLNENDKNKVINALEENAKNDKNQNTLNNLKNKVKKNYQTKILAENMKIKDENKDKEEPKEKPKLTEEQINNIAYEFSEDLYNKENEPKNNLENLIQNENKENKIEELAESMNKLDKDDQDKALLIINNNAINDEEKEKANKLSNLVKNLDNMKSYFGKMIKGEINKDEKEDEGKDKLYEQPLEGDLHEDEIEKIINSFWTDLNNNKNKNQNQDKINDIINNFANIIKELNPEDQNKAIKLLKDKTEKENKNKEEINNLGKKIDNLNNMKNEIESYANSIINKDANLPLENKEDKKDDNDKILYSKTYNIEIPEIVIDELEPKKLQQITDDFCADLADMDEKKPEDDNSSVKLRLRKNKTKEDDIKINNIANTITKLQEDDQKKVIENLEKNIKNDKLPKLIQKIDNIKKRMI